MTKPFARALWRPVSWRSNGRSEWSIELPAGISARVYYRTDKRWHIYADWRDGLRKRGDGFATKESAMVAVERELEEQIALALTELKSARWKMHP